MPSVFGIQETHMGKAGQIKLNDGGKYQIYEHVRTLNHGGGLALGVLKDLEPVWVRDGGEDVEALTVRVVLGNDIQMRIANAYGPQEYDCNEKKCEIWEYLNEEAFCSRNEDTGCLIMMDSNAWLGPKFITNDPHS